MAMSVRPSTELAVELNAPISTEDFRTLNRCLDDAIAGAVTEYGRERNQSGIDGESAHGTERLGFFAHELRNLLNTALMAFEVAERSGVRGIFRTVIENSWQADLSPLARGSSCVKCRAGTAIAQRAGV
jgi:hypothetical protein